MQVHGMTGRKDTAFLRHDLRRRTINALTENVGAPVDQRRSGSPLVRGTRRQDRFLLSLPNGAEILPASVRRG